MICPGSDRFLTLRGDPKGKLASVEKVAPKLLYAAARRSAAPDDRGIARTDKADLKTEHQLATSAISGDFFGSTPCGLREVSFPRLAPKPHVISMLSVND
jgi:hypothetical protein